MMGNTATCLACLQPMSAAADLMAARRERNKALSALRRLADPEPGDWTEALKDARILIGARTTSTEGEPHGNRA